MRVEERLPRGQEFLYALQHVFVSNVWLDPVFVASMIGLPFALASNMVNAIFIAAGLVTLTQATRLARLPIVQGPSAAFDSLMITTGKANGLAAAGGGIILSALIFFLLAITGVLGKMRKLFTPAVTGSVLFIVGVALSGFTFFEFLGGEPSMGTFLNPITLAMSIPTSLLVIFLSVFGRGKWKSFSFLVALIVGDLIAASLGQIHLKDVADKAWFGLPTLFPYGMIQFEWKSFITFFFAYLIAIVEGMGVYHAASEIVNEPLSNERIRNGFAGEAVGSAVSAAIGGFATTAYAQNVGLLKLSGVASRHVVKIAGVIFLILGLIPKAGAVLALTPDAVVGGLFLPATASLIFAGIQTLSQMEKSEANYMIAGLSILFAIALPAALKGIGGIAGQLLTNSIFIGAATAFILQIILVSIPKGVRKP